MESVTVDTLLRAADLQAQLAQPDKPGTLSQAFTLYERAVETDPRHVAALTGLAQFAQYVCPASTISIHSHSRVHTCCSTKLKDPELARTYFERALAVAPANVRMVRTYVAFLHSRGNNTRAEEVSQLSKAAMLQSQAAGSKTGTSTGGRRRRRKG